MPDVRKVSKVLIQEPGGKLLLMRRSIDDDRRPGEMDFPGGSVDAGESFELAAQREIMEEAGVDIPLDQLSIVYAHTSINEGKNTIRVLSAARVTTIPHITLSDEHDAYWWKTADEIIAEFEHPVYKSALMYLQSHKLI